MFGKIIENLYKWHYNRELKKHQKKKLTEVEKKKIEFYQNMQILHGFVTWINTKGFASRRERKTFWRNIMEGHSNLETTIADLMDKYAPEKVKKDKEQNRVKPERMDNFEKGAKF